MKNNVLKKLNKELASANVWFLLACLIAMSLYAKVGHGYLKLYYSQSVSLLIFFTLLIVTLSAIGFSFYTVFICGKSQNSLKRDIKKQLDELNQFINEAHKRLRDYEILARRHCLEIHPQSIECLGRNRRILMALRERVMQAYTLLQSGGTFDLIEAYDLLNQKLEVTENSMEKLIQTDPIQPIDPNQWVKAVEEMFEEVEFELERVAA